LTKQDQRPFSRRWRQKPISLISAPARRFAGQIFAIACRTQPQPCCNIALDNLLQIPKQEKARLK
jgi:hypothetical protein